MWSNVTFSNWIVGLFAAFIVYDSIPSITLCSNEYNYNNLNQINFIIIIKSWSDEKVIQSWLTRGFCHSYSDHLLKLPAYITIHSSLSLRVGWSNIQYLFSIWKILFVAHVLCSIMILFGHVLVGHEFVLAMFVLAVCVFGQVCLSENCKEYKTWDSKAPFKALGPSECYKTDFFA